VKTRAEAHGANLNDRAVLQSCFVAGLIAVGDRRGVIGLLPCARPTPAFQPLQVFLTLAFLALEIVICVRASLSFRLIMLLRRLRGELQPDARAPRCILAYNPSLAFSVFASSCRFLENRLLRRITLCCA
jgi:hypothetical protein